MYDIIPLIFILISLSMIIIIVVRKFSALANLNVDEIPAEKEAKFKERIISNRLKRNFVKWSAKLMKIILPAGMAMGNFFKMLTKKISDLKYDVETDNHAMSDEELKQKIEKIFVEAGESEKKSELQEAEKKYIEIIGLDSKNIRAFNALANIYFERKEYNEAVQTFRHILKLAENSDDESGYSQIYFELALVNKAIENTDEALANVKKALEIEPNNPRYLDTMLEISIISKDKALAVEVFKKLQTANPGNKKLDELKNQISEM